MRAELAPPERRRALVLVDLQNDFMPGGALPVPNGNDVVTPIIKLVHEQHWDVVIATQDWHPDGHSSFKENGGPFPVHCLQGSFGARLEWRVAHVERIAAIVRKGMDPKKDELAHPRISHLLVAYQCAEIHFVGLAREYCVLEHALACAQDGGSAFRPHFHWDLTRPVDPSTDEATRRTLTERGVKIV